MTRNLIGYAVTRQRERELIRAAHDAVRARRAQRGRNPYADHGPRRVREIEALVVYYHYRENAHRVIAAHSWRIA